MKRDQSGTVTGYQATSTQLWDGHGSSVKEGGALIISSIRDLTSSSLPWVFGKKSHGESCLLCSALKCIATGAW